MAVFGIGSHYDGEDVTKDFIKDRCACIGYEKPDASSLYEMFRRVKLGDIIYIKSFVHGKLFIKGIGIVTGKIIKEYNFPKRKETMGHGREVIWKRIMIDRDDWIEIDLTPEEIKNNVYNNTLYEEYSERIIKNVIEILLGE